jgi:hypothetical protein
MRALRRLAGRVAKAVVAVLVLLLVVGVVAAVLYRGGSRPLPSLTSGFDCSGPYPDATAYTGPAPHPVVIVTDSNVNRDGQWVPDNDAFQQAAYRLNQAVWHPEEPRSVQLIACVTEQSTGPEVVKLCPYQNESGPKTDYAPYKVAMYQGVFDVTLYELRTHRKVAGSTLLGEWTDCPSEVPAGTGLLATQPSVEQYLAALRHFVER